MALDRPGLGRIDVGRSGFVILGGLGFSRRHRLSQVILGMMDMKKLKSVIWVKRGRIFLISRDVEAFGDQILTPRRVRNIPIRKDDYKRPGPR